MIMGWVCHWDRIGVGEGIHGIDAAFTSKRYMKKAWIIVNTVEPTIERNNHDDQARRKSLISHALGDANPWCFGQKPHKSCLALASRTPLAVEARVVGWGSPAC